VNARRKLPTEFIETLPRRRKKHEHGSRVTRLFTTSQWAHSSDSPRRPSNERAWKHKFITSKVRQWKNRDFFFFIERVQKFLDEWMRRRKRWDVWSEISLSNSSSWRTRKSLDSIASLHDSFSVFLKSLLEMEDFFFWLFEMEELLCYGFFFEGKLDGSGVGSRVMRWDVSWKLELRRDWKGCWWWL
jgi:hypothetical protein